MDLMSLLLGTLTSGDSVNALSQKTGLSSDKLVKLVTSAIPVLLKSLTKNASSQDGAQSLLTALSQHKETRTMAEQIGAADEQDGEKIIHHILGAQSDDVVKTLAKDADMDGADATKALSSFAPALMSGLSAATTSASKVDLSDGLDLSDLMAMFGGAQAKPASESNGLLGGLLGGGQSPLGGLLGGGEGGGIGSLLGGLFGGAENKEQQTDAFDSNALLGTLTSLLK